MDIESRTFSREERMSIPVCGLSVLPFPCECYASNELEIGVIYQNLMSWLDPTAFLKESNRAEILSSKMRLFKSVFIEGRLNPNIPCNYQQT